MSRRKLSPEERWERSQRREAIALIVVSGVFVLFGGILALTGEVVAILVILFFFGCLFAGIMRLPGVSARTALLALILGCFGFAAACAGILILALTGVPFDSAYLSQRTLALIAAVGVVFFGGGGILLAVLAWRNRSGPNASPPR